ncbi:PREDICTED: long-chain-alcohol O-fatty-acyltransferase-like [Nelumbo nucifera]|uniref:Wax synthase domain-containing protein n=2 Tax=Nelumbo nucifera TaxID=4432 RepID=A0A822XU82_NELNU|nr:PREDICTED: long-chain-alcohol O-fatty-acyltransferase-like [Nelumbo nucifera]DAD23552.1 TPA_asm: hypothetical protein HUJ06_025015 [Nelumbo nucifera]
MDDEINNFIKVWISALASLFYCYSIAGKFPKGVIRLLSLLPVLCLFTILPLNLSSFHLGAPTAFYLAWLGNFKLLLFSLDQGPLSSRPAKSLLGFVSIASLPIKVKPDPSLGKSHQNSGKSLQSRAEESPSPCGSHLKLAVECLVSAVLIKIIYDYKQQIHPSIFLCMYCCNLFLGLEITLAMGAAVARALLGLDLEPQFNEPYLTTSLQDFWGRRWNLMVSSILRPTVYDPVRRISAPVFGTRWAPLPAVVAAFTVSGLMHELIYYYLTRVDPTWEVTWFFVFQGLCVATEVAVKKWVNGRWKLQRQVSGPLTLSFIAATGARLFFPQLLWNGVDERAIGEYAIVVKFLRNRLRPIF